MTRDSFSKLSVRSLFSGLLMVLALLLGLQTHAESVPYTKVALMDLDELDAYVKGKVKEAKSAIEKDGVASGVALYQEALLTIFSRPNPDSMIEKLIEPLRSGLLDHNEWDNSLRSLTDKAISELKEPKDVPAIQQVTDLIVLNNFVTEFAPEAKKSPVMTEIYEKIRDAGISASGDARKEIVMKGFTGLLLPSEKAGAVLPKAEPDNGAKKKTKRK